MKLDKPIKTDCDAWKFLVKMGGEFRIHTNKDGLRVYISALNKKCAGFYKHYEKRWDLSKPFDENTCAGRPAYIHREGICETDSIYSGSETGKTLVEAVNKHIELMPGYVYIPWPHEEDFEEQINEDSDLCHWTLEFKGSLEEFKELATKNKNE